MQSRWSVWDPRSPKAPVARSKPRMKASTDKTGAGFCVNIFLATAMEPGIGGKNLGKAALGVVMIHFYGEVLLKVHPHAVQSVMGTIVVYNVKAHTPLKKQYSGCGAF